MEIVFFRSKSGREPAREWLEKLAKKEPQQHDLVLARLNRISATNYLGDARPAGGPVSELRFHGSSGYRLYCVVRGSQLIILLCGGNKSTQDSDIRKAHKYWEEHNAGNNP